MNYTVAAAFVALGASPALAQGIPIPVEASIQAPDLRVADGQLGDERKYFLFHKQGASFAEAYTDLAFCSRYVARGPQRSLPDFVPWQRDDPARPMPVPMNFGLVGLGIAAIIDGPIDRSIRQSRMMRCMLPRGYARYRTSQAVWKQVEGSPAVQARIASGPVPPTPRANP